MTGGVEAAEGTHEPRCSGGLGSAAEGSPQPRGPWPRASGRCGRLAFGALALTIGWGCAEEPVRDGGVGEAVRPSYTVRLDSESSAIEEYHLVEDDDGIRVQTGPAGIAYRSDDTAGSGDFRLQATFAQYDAPIGYREAFGLFLGGIDLDTPDHEYTYLLVRTTGDFLIKRDHRDARRLDPTRCRRLGRRGGRPPHEHVARRGRGWRRHLLGQRHRRRDAPDAARAAVRRRGRPGESPIGRACRRLGADLVGYGVVGRRALLRTDRRVYPSTLTRQSVRTPCSSG